MAKWVAPLAVWVTIAMSALPAWAAPQQFGNELSCLQGPLYLEALQRFASESANATVHTLGTNVTGPGCEGYVLPVALPGNRISILYLTKNRIFTLPMPDEAVKYWEHCHGSIHRDDGEATQGDDQLSRAVREALHASQELHRTVECTDDKYFQIKAPGSHRNMVIALNKNYEIIKASCEPQKADIPSLSLPAEDNIGPETKAEVKVEILRIIHLAMRNFRLEQSGAGTLFSPETASDLRKGLEACSQVTEVDDDTHQIRNDALTQLRILDGLTAASHPSTGSPVQTSGRPAGAAQQH